MSPKLISLLILSLSLAIPTADAIQTPPFGEMKQWHKLTIDFTGPQSSEDANPNPFTDYRLDVTFAQASSGKTYVVPGFYAADGDAANTSASSGDLWRVYFAPDEIGEWTYSASFRSGSDIATSTAAGTSAGFFDGESGIFDIAPSDKTGIDLRSKGRLEYVGKHHLRFAGNGQYFMKAGTDSPENLLAYQDFDGDFKTDGQRDNYIKDWAPHLPDWQTGDPVWQGTKGKGIIGAINYLASEGLNTFSFLTMNINGDDQNVFPYTNYDERVRLDVSRLDQWGIVFEHGTKMGMHLHFKTQENENQRLLDGGDLGNQRKLYYRELIARFGHNLALNWNLGEECTVAYDQKSSWAQYFYDTDPYHHPIVIHNGSSHYNMMGSASKLTGFSLQLSNADYSDMFEATKNYVDLSDNSGRPWVVACDEPGDSRYGLRPDSNPGNSHIDGRKDGLWGNIMAGGAGCEFFFGREFPQTDLTTNDFRSRDAFWDCCRSMLELFDGQSMPFQLMKNQNSLVSGSGVNANRCLARIGDTYLVQLRNGGTHTLNLSTATGTFTVKWFNPRTGGPVIEGPPLEAGGIVSLGSPPDTTTEDWIVLVQSTTGSTGINSPPHVEAGDNRSVFLSGETVALTLHGTVSDDGLPDPFLFSSGWTVASGPAPVTFLDPSNSNTTATFSATGTYVLRLSASDSDLDDADDITVEIKPPFMGGDVAFAPSQDAFTDVGANDNGEILRVADGTRIAYLQFDLSTLAATPSGSILHLTEADGLSPGTITLHLYAALSNEWTESTITAANAPAKGDEIATFTGDLLAGQSINFDLGSHVTTPGIYGFILEAEATPGSIAFASKENLVIQAIPSLVATLPPNSPPLFDATFIATPVNQPVTIPYSQLLSGASDPDGDPVSLMIEDFDSTNGANITMAADSLTYTPIIDVAGLDSFTLTAQDGRGGETSAEFPIEITESNGIEDRIPAVALTPEGAVSIHFSGLPGFQYTIERSTDLLDWTALETLGGGYSGEVEFIDAPPFEGAAFYRIRTP